MTRPRILTIAGSDSGGGAGIQADLKAIAALGGYGMSVITALTAQSGLGVFAIHAPDASFVVAQLKAVIQGFDVSAAKTGMLFSAEIISAVAHELQRKTFPLVVDPVSLSQSGHKLLQDEAITALKKELLPLADLLTPNMPEAELLTGLPVRSAEDVTPAIEALLALGCKAVLLKGGHAAGLTTEVVDWLGRPGRTPLPLVQPRVNTPNTHGTGCTLSAAIATGLGAGMALEDAVRRAQSYLNLCLRRGYAPGLGFGPPNHLAPFDL